MQLEPALEYRNITQNLAVFIEGSQLKLSIHGSNFTEKKIM